MIIVPREAIMVSHTPASTQLISEAAANCYKSLPKDKAAHVRRIVRQYKHESVVEHASATFRIVCDRATMAQITRHRIASYSIESQRYCNYAKESGNFNGSVSFIAPFGITEDAYPLWVDACKAAERDYCNMLSLGCAPEVARSVLPNCVATTIYMTCNFRSWMHFIELRTSNHAQGDIREIANHIKAQLTGVCPAVFGEHE